MAIINGAPIHVNEGINDLSVKTVYPKKRGIPQFLPKMYLNTQMGTYDEMQVTGDELIANYGFETMNKLSKYSNHASIMAAQILGNGGQIVVKRLRPHRLNPDGTVSTTELAPIASKTFYLVVSDPVTSAAYVRNADNTVARDLLNGNTPVYDTSKDIEARYVGVTAIDTSAGVNVNTITTVADGIFVDNGKGAVVETGGTIYPLFTLPAAAHGEYYNNLGIKIVPLTGRDVDKDKLAKSKEFQYGLQVYDKTSGRAIVKKTITGSEQAVFTLNPDAVDPITNTAIALTDIIPGKWFNQTDPNIPIIPRLFDDVVYYSDSTVEALKVLTTTEVNTVTVIGNVAYDNIEDVRNPTTSGDTPTIIAEGDKYLINPFTRKSSKDVEYEAIRPIQSISQAVKDQVGALTDLGGDTIAYLEGGEDGAVEDLDEFENNVISEINLYNDIDSPVYVIARNPESVFIDSGYQVSNKLKLGAFISKRKDTFLVGSTYVWNKENRKQTIGEALAIASLVKSVWQLSPESKTFGTKTARAMILMGSGVLADGTYKYRMPLTYDWAGKATRFMGAGNGKWNGNYEFSTQPRNIVEDLIDIDTRDVPTSIRAKLFSSGIVWVDPDDRVTYFYPQQQTIYDEATSVLNSAVFLMACCTIAKANEKMWRRYTGATNLTREELKLRIEEDLARELNDRFNGQYIIKPEVYYTEDDILRGYSGHLKVEIYAPMMNTTLISHIDALRIDDL